ncbi:MAG: SMI1/KNR4 family protein [Flavobacteriales bacterium]|nr:SMI1/KNR4 family protein [Flavobacteriales bacterium]
MMEFDLTKTSMNTPYPQLLKTVSINAIKLGDFDYPESAITQQWLGTEPATPQQIKATEKRLGIQLPKAYIDFITTTNGFQATSSVYPTFHPIEQIDYMYNIDPFQVDLWLQEGTEDIGKKLQRSLLVAGIGEEQYFLLIPPLAEEPWEYWSFAAWYPGEVPHSSFKAFWLEVNHFIITSNN